MRAFAVKEFAHPSKITLTNDFAEPEAGPNDVIVDVYSAGLNYFDVSELNSLRQTTVIQAL